MAGASRIFIRHHLQHMEIELVVSAACQFGLPEPIQILFSTYILGCFIWHVTLFRIPFPSISVFRCLPIIQEHTRTTRNVPVISPFSPKKRREKNTRPWHISCGPTSWRASAGWPACARTAWVPCWRMTWGWARRCSASAFCSTSRMGDVDGCWCP